MKLNDLVSVNSEYIEKFLKSKNPNPGTEEKTKVALEYIKESYSMRDLQKYFSKADLLFDNENSVYIFSCYTKDSLGISIGVPHAIGDHAEFEIKYKDIVQNIKMENDVWKGLSAK